MHNRPIFLNFSNHPSQYWTPAQRNAALALAPGEIVDLPFPAVSPQADEAEIRQLAQAAADQICQMAPQVVMCQGEFGVTFHVVRLLQARGIPVVYSCSQRRVVEQQTSTGTRKTAEFSFVRFRQY